ncbi:MAG: accessory gene regulator B family protein [Oscillospiraceae bacterium]|nr:accessory gene regulator B family protein [Oscillospiraceae bacterium]
MIVLIEKTAIMLTNKLNRNNIIEDDARDIYIYGFDLVISAVINFALILVLAFLYGRPLDAVIYMLCTRPLRTNGGGWHANTHGLCMTLHAAAFSLVSWLSFGIWEFMPWFVLFVIHAVSFIVVWVKAPVEHPNNPLEEDAKGRMRLKCIVCMGLIMAVSIIFLVVGQQYVSVLMTLSAASAVGTFLVPNKHEGS